MVFQGYVEKRHEYRVTVVGREVFACRIDSQAAGGETAIDWRNYDIPSAPHLAVDPEDRPKGKLVELVGRLSLTYGAVDLVGSPRGEFCSLGVNGMGVWLWVEGT
jgi:hypothetical protein